MSDPGDEGVMAMRRLTGDQIQRWLLSHIEYWASFSEGKRSVLGKAMLAELDTTDEATVSEDHPINKKPTNGEAVEIQKKDTVWISYGVPTDVEINEIPEDSICICRSSGNGVVELLGWIERNSIGTTEVEKKPFEALGHLFHLQGTRTEPFEAQHCERCGDSWASASMMQRCAGSVSDDEPTNAEVEKVALLLANAAYPGQLPMNEALELIPESAAERERLRAREALRLQRDAIERAEDAERELVERKTQLALARDTRRIWEERTRKAERERDEAVAKLEETEAAFEFAKKHDGDLDATLMLRDIFNVLGVEYGNDAVAEIKKLQADRDTALERANELGMQLGHAGVIKEPGATCGICRWFGTNRSSNEEACEGYSEIANVISMLHDIIDPRPGDIVNKVKKLVVERETIAGHLQCSVEDVVERARIVGEANAAWNSGLQDLANALGVDSTNGIFLQEFIKRAENLRQIESKQKESYEGVFREALATIADDLRLLGTPSLATDVPEAVKTLIEKQNALRLNLNQATSEVDRLRGVKTEAAGLRGDLQRAKTILEGVAKEVDIEAVDSWNDVTIPRRVRDLVDKKEHAEAQLSALRNKYEGVVEAIKLFQRTGE